MKKFVTLCFLVMLLFVAPAFGSIPMPYCACEDLAYTPAGPWIPDIAPGVIAPSVGSGLDGELFDFSIDYGDLPYSVPNYGWHTKVTDNVYPMKADLYGLSSLLNLRFYDLFCCDAFPTVDDPLFSQDGVTFTWNADAGFYQAFIGDNQYVAVFYEATEGHVAKVFLHKFTDGNLYLTAAFSVFVPGPMANTPAPPRAAD